MENLLVYDVNRYDYDDEYLSAVSGIRVGNVHYYLCREDDKSVIWALSDDLMAPMDLISTGEVCSRLRYFPSAGKVFVAHSKSVALVDRTLQSDQLSVDADTSLASDPMVTGEWDSDGENFAAVFKSGEIKVFNIDWNQYTLVNTASILQTTKVYDDVYLGWGRRSTQFKGEFANVAPASDYVSDSEQVCLRWFYGEKFFAVNMRVEDERVIRILDHDCNILAELSASEHLNGLLDMVAYRPKRNMFGTACQNNEGEQYVVLFEPKGGIRHIIDAKNAKVKELAWSTCGDLLAVWYLSDKIEGTAGWISLYTQNCERWQIKQRLPLNEDNDLVELNFKPTLDDVIPLELFLRNTYKRYDYMRICATYQTNTCYDIKGTTLTVTDFESEILPPEGYPQGQVREHEFHINAVVLHPTLPIIVLIDDFEIARVYQVELDTWTLQCQMELSEEDKVPLASYKYGFMVQDGTNLFVTYSSHPNDSSVYIRRYYNLDTGARVHTYLMEKQLTLFKNYPLLGDLITPTALSNRPISHVITFLHEGCSYEVLLRTSGHLIVNSQFVFNNVSSVFKVHEKFLALTRREHNEPADVLGVIDITRCAAEHNMERFCWTRTIEKGAKVCAYIRDKFQSILSVPRGNLETIVLRPVFLSDLVRRLKNCQFGNAVSIITRNNLDMDLLHDLAPEIFKENLPEIISAMGSFEAYVRFLANLKDESVLELKDELFVSKEPVENKRKSICSILLQYLVGQENLATTLKLQVVTYWAKGGKDITDTMKYFSEIVNGDYEKYEIEIKGAIETLSLYVNGKDLYQEALSIYDCQLAEMVAEKTQMDPQVYQTFLNSVKSAPQLHARFKINNEIGKFGNATKYLIMLYREDSEYLDQLISYVDDKRTIEVAMSVLSRTDGEAYRIVCAIYAEDLLKQKKYLMSGSVFLGAGELREALNAFKMGCEYLHAALVVSLDGSYTDAEKYMEHTNLADLCIEIKKFEDAAAIQFQFLDDSEKGFAILLQGQCFRAAERRLDSRDIFDMLPVLVAAIHNHVFGTLRPICEELEAKLKTSFERLKAVRIERSEKMALMEYGTVGFGNFMDDVFSDSSSHASKASSKTTKSTKLQRKMRSLKKGSKYEDIALLYDLHEICQAIYRLAEEMNECFQIGALYPSPEVKQIYVQVRNLQELMIKCADDIWLPSYLNSVESLEDYFVTENIALLEMKYRIKPDILMDTSKILKPMQ